MAKEKTYLEEQLEPIIKTYPHGRDIVEIIKQQLGFGYYIVDVIDQGLDKEIHIMADIFDDTEDNPVHSILVKINYKPETYVIRSIKELERIN